MAGLVDATPKQLWAAVKPKQQKSNYCASLDADMVNIFLCKNCHRLKLLCK